MNDKHRDDPADARNAADVAYLADALTAVIVAVQLSNVAAVQGADEAVRDLARMTLASQSHLAGVVSDCLTAPEFADVHEHLTTTSTRLRPGEAAQHLQSFDGPPLDRRFLELLKTHIRASVDRAQAQMVAGMHPRARQVAEDAIHAHSRELEAIERMTAEIDAAPDHEDSVSSAPATP